MNVFAKQLMSDGEKDIYDDEGMEEQLEGDEIDSFEEGFMRGHKKAEEETEEEEE